MDDSFARLAFGKFGVWLKSWKEFSFAPNFIQSTRNVLQDCTDFSTKWLCFHPIFFPRPLETVKRIKSKTNQDYFSLHLSICQAAQQSQAFFHLPLLTQVPFCASQTFSADHDWKLSYGIIRALLTDDAARRRTNVWTEERNGRAKSPVFACSWAMWFLNCRRSFSKQSTFL